MTFSRLLTVLAIIATGCSISGITMVSIYQYLSGDQKLAGGLYFIIIALLVLALIGIWILWDKLRQLSELHDGTIAYLENRSQISTDFANGTLRQLKIFAGDLSWLEEDIITYRNLRQRNVRIYILTDNPSASAISTGKSYGIEFRKYPNGIEAPLKVSLSDSDEESEARAFTVKRRTYRPGNKKQNEYHYWMKEYHGQNEFIAIKAMAALFDIYWDDGEII